MAHCRTRPAAHRVSGSWYYGFKFLHCTDCCRAAWNCKHSVAPNTCSINTAHKHSHAWLVYIYHQRIIVLVSRKLCTRVRSRRILDSSNRRDNCVAYQLVWQPTVH